MIRQMDERKLKPPTMSTGWYVVVTTITGELSKFAVLLVFGTREARTPITGASDFVCAS
jgi:hypothetical protein